jgi:hypothetical protein
MIQIFAYSDIIFHNISVVCIIYLTDGMRNEYIEGLHKIDCE